MILSGVPAPISTSLSCLWQGSATFLFPRHSIPGTTFSRAAVDNLSLPKKFLSASVLLTLNSIEHWNPAAPFWAVCFLAAIPISWLLFCLLIVQWNPFFCHSYLAPKISLPTLRFFSLVFLSGGLTHALNDPVIPPQCFIMSSKTLTMGATYLENQWCRWGLSWHICHSSVANMLPSVHSLSRDLWLGSWS